ncbi:MAG: beta-ketoacyl synthase N-terminal-like domain-containing protein, partial [Thermodesulfobacteriota bacterium]
MMQPACPIAVIGIGCLFPGSRNAREFWNTIVNGVDCIGEVPPTHWSRADYFDANPKAPDCVYCTRGGFLPEIDFDPAAFGIPPANLDATDTSQLLGLVVARAALEDAGYLDRPFDRDKAAVILGVTGTQELTIPLASRLGHPHWRRALAEAGVDPATAETVIERIAACYVRWQENSFPGLLGNVVAGRIANRLDLRGPNCVVDAACASSLAALNLALQELEGGRSDLVITGGVDTLNDIFMHMCFSQSGLLSKTGDIRPFSAEADGTLLGEGIGMVVLKRLADAQRDGDRVYAVIRGLGASSDGKSQSIYAPRVEGQVQALRKAYEAAGIDPTTVGLIEAHGTGTRVGDRVEVEALRRVYCGAGKAGSAKRHVLGSVKSQIGHTKAAAGAAGLIKAVLSLHHKVLPPTIKVDRPDPELGIDEGPFELNTATRAWLRPPDGPPRRAAVSSFGFGGSNFHVVLEEADPKRTDVLWDEGVQIVAFSAADRSDLSDGVERWVERAASCPERLPVLAEETRRSFRADGRFRLLAVVRTTATDAEGQGWLADLRAAQRMIREGGGDLEPVLAETVYFGSGPNPPKLGILFPGQGSQKPGMAKDWFVRFPSAFSLLEAMGAALSDPAAFYDVLNSGSDVCPADLSKRLGTTDIAQPAIGAVSIGMWSVLHGFGVSADVFCGHSYGELCALHAAGRIERDAFIRLSVARGRWMAEAALQSSGGMIAVLAEESVSKDLCRDVASLVLANRNAPRQQVFSGPLDAIERAKLLCDARGVRSVRLPVSAAFHSPAMRPAVDRFLEALRLETIHPSERVVLSNADGKPFPDEADALRLRLADQIASTVDFVSCIQAMRDRGIGVFLEVGPKTVLSGLVREMTAGCGTPMPAVRILSMDRGTGNACMDLAHVLCSLAAAGYPVVLDRWNPGHPRPDETRKPAMSVRICGANYRHPQTFPVANAVVKPFSETTKPKTPSIAEPMSRWSTENPMQPKPVSASCSETPSWHETLQQGIRSIEAIQRQTAELHQQFLATQAEAMRLVQQILSGPPAAVVGMSDNELRLTEVRRPVIPNSPGTDSRTVDSSLPSGHRVQAANGYRSHAVPKEAQEANDRHPATSGTHRMSMPPEADRFRETSPMAAAPNACTETVPSIASVLLDVVSRLTGYPVDVLGLDMDIEADLGIDSIKRVEILSAMEEAVAGLVVPAP